MKKLLESFPSLITILIITLFISAIPVKAAGPAIAGHYLKTGEVLVGVTGSAPVANKLTGTANQITVTTAAEGGNLTLSFPTSVTMTNLTVSGTLSPYTTGTFTADDVSLNYGISAATGVYTGAVTAASFGATGALTGATLATTGAGTIVGDFKAGAANYVSTMTASNGNWAITGNVVSLAAVQGATVTGTTSVGVPTTGMVLVGLRTIAQLMAATAVAGQMGICSNCSPVEVFISTGAGAPNTGGYGNAAGAQLN